MKILSSSSGPQSEAPNGYEKPVVPLIEKEGGASAIMYTIIIGIVVLVVVLAGVGYYVLTHVHEGKAVGPSRTTVLINTILELCFWHTYSALEVYGVLKSYSYRCFK